MGPIITTIDHVIAGTFELNAGLARHADDNNNYPKTNQPQTTKLDPVFSIVWPLQQPRRIALGLVIISLEC